MVSVAALPFDRVFVGFGNVRRTCAAPDMEPGTKVVVIEDLISTAGSCIDVVDALREAGAEVLGVVSIFTYGMQKGLDRLAAANVKNTSLSNLDALLEVAVKENYISPAAKDAVKTFRDNPSDESWIAMING